MKKPDCQCKSKHPLIGVSFDEHGVPIYHCRLCIKGEKK